ncbi:hypothetical protein Tco_1361962 [Tanacetum coccineum]
MNLEYSKEQGSIEYSWLPSEEGKLNFEESFASGCQSKAIRIFLRVMPLTIYMVVYQMDVKTAFLNVYLRKSRRTLTYNFVYACVPVSGSATEKALTCVQKNLPYLKGTVNQRLWYPKDSSIALTTFADADHAGCQDTRRSTSGSMQFLGDKPMLAWSQKGRKARCDNPSNVENDVIELYFVNTEYQLADIFTKALARERIEFLINKLGMRSFTPKTLKQLADEVDE